jgi:hypothetical protein
MHAIKVALVMAGMRIPSPLTVVHLDQTIIWMGHRNYALLILLRLTNHQKVVCVTRLLVYTVGQDYMVVIIRLTRLLHFIHANKNVAILFVETEH